MSKDLSNKPINAVLNTHNLDMILQLKYILELLWSVTRLIVKTSSVTPDFFFTFLLQSYNFLRAVKVLKSFVRGKFWARTSLNSVHRP